MKKIFCLIIILSFIGCTGFNDAFRDSSGGAYKANGLIYLARACGGKIAARAIDMNGDGVAEGIDLNGDGITDMNYIYLIHGQLAGLDVNGDGVSDYYLNVELNDEIKIYTDQTGGNPITLTADATGKVTGFDLTGDCIANNTIITDIRNDSIAPTSAANSSGGAFNSVQSVTLTCTDNIACNGIAYTLNGSSPDFEGNGGVLVGASGTITINKSVALHWRARDSNGNLEATVHKISFQILGANVTLPPTYTPAIGYYSSAQNITLTNATVGATICYTTNLTTPSCNASGNCSVGTTYIAPISVPTVAIIQTMACKLGLSSSPVIKLAYAVDSTPPANAVSFAAAPGDGQISLSWVNPADSDLAGIRIVRKTGSYPANANDGTVVYTSLGTSYVDTTVANGTQYYYTAFAYDGATNYAAGVQATSTPSGGIVNAPLFSPIAGTYGNAQNISITSTSPGTTICYSTAGTPSCSAGPTCVTSTQYSSAVNIPSTSTLRAIACKTGFVDSGVTTGVYTIDTSAPANVTPFNATPGNTQINLSWTNPGDGDLAGIKILRKTGGYPSNDTDGTVVYNSTGTSIVDSGLTNGTQYFYTAFSYDIIGNYASGTQATATPVTGPANAPTYSPVAGTFGSTQNVAISSTTVGSTLCYTTDGSAPSCDATPTCNAGFTYSVAVAISSTSTLRAVACKSGYTDSSITTGTYTIDTTPPTPGTGISFSSITSSGLSVNWGAATDDVTTPANLQYKVVKDNTSTANIDTIAEADAKSGADLLQNWTTSITTKAVSGLTVSTVYHFAVLVRDGVGNVALYTPASQSTGPDTTAPSVPGLFSAGGSDTTSLTLTWFASTDNVTPQSSLVYEVCQSTSAGGCNTFAVTYTSSAGAVNYDVTPLSPETTYYFRIRARDAAGNTSGSAAESAAYTSPARRFTIWPDTGQTQCSGHGSLYGDAGLTSCPQTDTGQDGDLVNVPVARSFTGPTQHVTYTNDYTTADNVTGLIWKSCTEGRSGATCTTGANGNFTWVNAQAQCNGLNSANAGAGYAGRTDWRLPEIDALKSIVDYSGISPTIDATYFPTPTTLYWSSNSSLASSADAMVIWFSGGGYSATRAKTSTAPTRCVAGGTPAAPSFTDLGDGTIRDNNTTLIWQKCSRGQTYSGGSCTGAISGSVWVDGLAYCNSLTLGGHSWHLPSVNELGSIMDYSRIGRAINTTYFPFTLGGNDYWVSTSRPFSVTVTYGGYYDIRDGSWDYKGKNNTFTYTRCVAQ